MNKTHFEKNLDAKTLTTTRVFQATLDQVWDAYTVAEIFEQWWAPKPWKAVVESFDFKPGGRCLYYMAGPNGEKSWCIIHFKNIDPKKSFSISDAFCDSDGNESDELKPIHWDISFEELEDEVQVVSVLQFESLDEMNKVLEMGFKEGYTMAQEQLQTLLT